MGRSLEEHHRRLQLALRMVHETWKEAAVDGYQIEAEVLPGEPVLGIPHTPPVLHSVLAPPVTANYNTPVHDRPTLGIMEYRQEVTDGVRGAPGWVFPAREGFMAITRRYYVDQLGEIPGDATHVVWYDD